MLQGPAQGVECERACVRACCRDLPKVLSACSLLAEYDGHVCRVCVTKTSPFLQSLAIDSRAFLQGLLKPAESMEVS